MFLGRLDEMKKAGTHKVKMHPRIEQGNPGFLPVFLTGGIGDAILSIGTLKRFSREGFKMLIYSHHSEALQYFYKDEIIRKGDLPNFTWCIHVDSVVKFKFNNQFAGFELPEHKKLFLQQQSLFRDRHDLAYLIQNHHNQKYVLTNKLQEIGIGAQSSALFSLGYQNIETEPPLTRPPAENYITIHDGFDLNNKNMVTGRCTKQWNWEYWNSLVRLIKSEYPMTRVIQLGSKTSRIIDGIDSNMVNKTTLTEAFEIISRSRLHIDTCSGLVHAATQLGVPCIVMFGPTPKDFYGHSQNINLSSQKSCTGGCFHLTLNWMDKCPIGYDSPRCMDDITAVTVFESVQKLLYGI